MTWIFFAQSLFIALGTMMAGLLINQFDAHPVLLGCSVAIAATLGAIPACSSIYALAIVPSPVPSSHLPPFTVSPSRTWR